jgi:hypothetical protein
MNSFLGYAANVLRHSGHLVAVLRAVQSRT